MAGDYIIEDGPLYSKVRFCMDFTEGTSASVLFPMFNHALSQISSFANQLKAFSYAVGDIAQVAGYDQTSTITEAMTNLTRRGEVPGRGRMDVGAIALVPDGYMLQPATPTTLAGCTVSKAGSHFPVRDS